MSLVLVAEDDDDILALVVTCLTREGHEPVEARNGEVALELLRERTPDLAVLDIGLPKLDGMEVLNRMRADGTLRSVPVLLLTANAQESDVRRGYDAGADAYMRKPFSPVRFVEVVRSLLESQTPGVA